MELMFAQWDLEKKLHSHQRHNLMTFIETNIIILHNLMTFVQTFEVLKAFNLKNTKNLYHIRLGMYDKKI